MIKFRAWDKNTNDMVSVKTIDLERDGSIGCIVDYSGINLDVSECVLMQSTGLKDNNGVEIFEGDIAETRQSDLSNTPFEMVGGVVNYDSDYGMFKLVRKYGSKFHPFTIWLTNVEVIGNIYENPELLS